MQSHHHASRYHHHHTPVLYAPVPSPQYPTAHVHSPVTGYPAPQSPQRLDATALSATVESSLSVSVTAPPQASVAHTNALSPSTAADAAAPPPPGPRHIPHDDRNTMYMLADLNNTEHWNDLVDASAATGSNINDICTQVDVVNLNLAPITVHASTSTTTTSPALTTVAQAHATNVHSTTMSHLQHHHHQHYHTAGSMDPVDANDAAMALKVLQSLPYPGHNVRKSKPVTDGAAIMTILNDPFARPRNTTTTSLTHPNGGPGTATAPEDIERIQFIEQQQMQQAMQQFHTMVRGTDGSLSPAPPPQHVRQGRGHLHPSRQHQQPYHNDNRRLGYKVADAGGHCSDVYGGMEET